MLKKYFLSDNLIMKEECILLLGGFDGVHSGHKKLVDRAMRFSLPVGIMTIRGVKGGGSLFDLSEREEIFENLGISFALEMEFDEKFKNTTAEQFVSDILNKFNVRAFVCGKDFKFGRGAEGDVKALRAISQREVCAEDISVDSNGNKISTSTVKLLVNEGRVEGVKEILTSPFCVTGEVVHGRSLGGKMGFPTANIAYPSNKTPLKEAVYAVHVYIDGVKYRGIANYGRCPTFDVNYKLLEVYIHGYNGDLYSKTLRVYFDRKIRDIIKFSSKEELIAQLNLDLKEISDKL